MANHFFALFGLDVGFAIDKTQLKSKLLELQKQHHPDTTTDKSTAEQNASLINHAFSILNRDDHRAVYLLSLAGQDINPNQSINDLDFLDEMMEMRIQLDDANQSQELSALNDKIIHTINQHANAFQDAYTKQAWSLAQILAQKLQFLGKLQDDILAKYNQTLSHHQDDDDLYV